MVIDTSAILAILFGEPEARRIALALTRADQRLISAATMIETNVVIISRGHSEGVRELDLLIANIQPEIATVTRKQVSIARFAFHQFGRGRHEARLNFGDCFSYALAKEIGQPLLFKGNDFSLTDLEPVFY